MVLPPQTQASLGRTHKHAWTHTAKTHAGTATQPLQTIAKQTIALSPWRSNGSPCSSRPAARALISATDCSPGSRFNYQPSPWPPQPDSNNYQTSKIVTPHQGSSHGTSISREQMALKKSASNTTIHSIRMTATDHTIPCIYFILRSSPSINCTETDYSGCTFSDI